MSFLVLQVSPKDWSILHVGIMILESSVFLIYVGRYNSIVIFEDPAL